MMADVDEQSPTVSPEDLGSVGLDDSEEKILFASASVGDEEQHLSGPVFTPRLYKQRYFRVRDYLKPFNEKLRKVVDFGCAECKFLKRVRTCLPHVRTLVGVDIDGDLLNEWADDALETSDWVETFLEKKRAEPLRMEIFQGDITKFDSRLADVDAIVAIELIEHLHQPILERVPDIVFGQYQPRIVIFTTPNSEFNVLFNMETGPDGKRKFRHADHKFEWSRSEFQNWCEDITKRFPLYTVRYDGVGDAPEDCDLGPCSQIAIFEMDERLYANIYEEKRKAAENADKSGPYNMVTSVDFRWDPLSRVSKQLRRECNVAIGEIARQAPPYEYPKTSSQPTEHVSSEETKIPDELNPFRQSGFTRREIDHSLITERRGNFHGVLIPVQRLWDNPQISQFCSDIKQLSRFLYQDMEFRFVDNETFFYELLELMSENSDDEEEI